MKISLTLVIAILAFSVATSANARTTGCSAGVHTVGGASVRTFCGPAHATVHAAGKTLHFTGGQCEISGGYFTVNIGSITIGSSSPKFTYLGIDVKPPKAGSHSSQIVSWQTPGKRASVLPATVVVNAGLKSGTFSGPLLGGGSATGSFSC